MVNLCVMGDDVKYNDLMSKGQKCDRHSYMAGDGQWREEQISVFYDLKEKLKFISRDVLYLAIAIYDQYLIRGPHEGHSLKIMEGKGMKAHACLLIAYKFLNKNSRPLEKMMKILGFNQTRKEEIIIVQAEILQRIDFTIPYEQTYSSLRSAFELLDHERKIKEIAIRSLSLLKEAVLYSSQFSLDLDLGPIILQAILADSSSDARIREVYQFIKRKREVKQEKIPNQRKCLIIMAE